MQSLNPPGERVPTRQEEQLPLPTTDFCSPEPQEEQEAAEADEVEPAAQRAQAYLPVLPMTREYLPASQLVSSALQVSESTPQSVGMRLATPAPVEEEADQSKVQVGPSKVSLRDNTPPVVVQVLAADIVVTVLPTQRLADIRVRMVSRTAASSAAEAETVVLEQKDLWL